MNNFISQKNIYECDFDGSKGSEQRGNRIALVLTNNVSNSFSPTCWVVPITSRNKKTLPTHHTLYKENYPFFKYEENIILVEQMTVRDKCRIGDYIGKITGEDFDIIIKKIIDNLKTFS